jgi:hypothetical protein
MPPQHAPSDPRRSQRAAARRARRPTHKTHGRNARDTAAWSAQREVVAERTGRSREYCAARGGGRTHGTRPGGRARRGSGDRVRLFCCCVTRHLLRGRCGGPHPPTPSPAGDPAGEGGLRRAGWERRKKRAMGASQEARGMGVLCAPLLLPDHRREKGLGDEGHHSGLARSGARHDSKGAARPEIVARGARALRAHNPDCDVCGRETRAPARASRGARDLCEITFSSRSFRRCVPRRTRCRRAPFGGTERVPRAVEMKA